MSGEEKPGTAPIVAMRGIRKSFGELEVLKGIDLDIYPSEHVVIFGPSGSGKSTVLRSINLLEKPSSGSLRVGRPRVRTGPRPNRTSPAGRLCDCAGPSVWSSNSSICSPT